MPQGSKENVLSVLLKSLGQVGLAYPDVKREQEEQQRQSQIDAFNRWLQEQTLGLRRQETEANISNMQADNERMESQKRTDLLMKLLGGFRAEGSTPEQNFSYKYGGKDITQIPDVDLGMFMPSALQYKYPKMGTVRQGGGSGGGQGNEMVDDTDLRLKILQALTVKDAGEVSTPTLGEIDRYTNMVRAVPVTRQSLMNYQSQGAPVAQPQGITPTRRSDMPADWPGTEQEWQDYKRLKGL